MTSERTAIDTVGLQIDLTDAHMQREALRDIIRFICETSNVYADGCSFGEYKSGSAIYYKSTKLAEIYTGSFRSGTKINGYVLQYYIAIKFAGLKRYDDDIDMVSEELLFDICVYLNDERLPYKLTELDVCIDIPCPLSNVLSVCTRKSPKTLYHELSDPQPYDTTIYIEKLSKHQRKTAVLRAYTYDKASKERLPYELTRFELKLQSKFFNKYGFSLDAILKALNRYHVMYYYDDFEKRNVVNAYDSYAVVKHREVKRMQFEKRRLYPDSGYLDEFMNRIKPVSNPEKRY